MAHTKNPLLYPEIFFDMLSSARHNTWKPRIYGNHSQSPWTYNTCRDLQHKFAGFRAALRHATTASHNTLAQQASYRDLHHLSQGIKTCITRSPDRIHATLTFTYFSATRKLADLLTAPLADPIPEQILNEFAKSPQRADIQNGVAPPTQTPPPYGKLPTPFDDVNPTPDEYEQHRLTDLKAFRLALVERIKRSILTYQLSHPSLMGNPKIDFTPNCILATLSWMAANTEYHPSLDCAEALTLLLDFNTDNPDLPYI